MERPLLLFMRGASTPILCAAFFLTWWMCRPGQPFIKGQLKITGGIDPLEWLPEELNWSVFRDERTCLKEQQCEALLDIDKHPPLTQPPL